MGWSNAKETGSLAPNRVAIRLRMSTAIRESMPSSRRGWSDRGHDPPRSLSTRATSRETRPRTRSARSVSGNRASRSVRPLRTGPAAADGIRDRHSPGTAPSRAKPSRSFAWSILQARRCGALRSSAASIRSHPSSGVSAGNPWSAIRSRSAWPSASPPPAQTPNERE